MNYFSTLKNKCRTKIQPTLVFKFFFVVCLLFLLVVMVAYPEICSESFLDGLILFSSAVLPSLFPFLFITKMLTDFGLAQKIANFAKKPFKIVFGANPQSFYVLLMSLLCGYPVGAKIVSDMACNGQITKQEAEEMLPFCSSSGPLFVIGTVGFGMFGNKKFGIKLFLIHVLSVFAVAFIICNVRRIFRKKNNYLNSFVVNKNLDQFLAKNMIDTCSSVLLVGGFISFFYLVIDILTKFKILFPLTYIFAFVFGVFGIDAAFAKGISSGIVEMTRGCQELSLVGGNFSLVAVSAILAFGGISIILQSIAFLSKARISIKKFLGIKIMQTAIAVCIAILFSF